MLARALIVMDVACRNELPKVTQVKDTKALKMGEHVLVYYQCHLDIGLVF